LIDWMNFILQCLILAISLAILIKFSDIVSDSSYDIAKITGLGEMAVGFLILSIVTSLPELAVSISALNSGNVNIPIGTIFGSNIANIGLILGLTAILSPTAIMIMRKDLRILTLMLVIASLVPLQLLILSRFVKLTSFILLTIFVIFSIYSVRTRIPAVEEEPKKIERKITTRLVFVFGGITVIIISSQFVVGSSVAISNILAIDQAVIGATVIAIGTSLPELSVSLSSVRKGHTGLALGNILGSCITNLTLILGFILVSSQIKINLLLFGELIAMLIIVNIALWRFMVDRKIGLGEGLILLLIYLIFLASTLGIQVVILTPQFLIGVLMSATDLLLKTFTYAIVGIVAFILGWFLGRG
jgi:cation:H+ antiporter